MRVIMCAYGRILGLGNAADAIEILSIGYILAVYEDKEGTLTRAQQSTSLISLSLHLISGNVLELSSSDRVAI